MDPQAYWEWLARGLQGVVRLVERAAAAGPPPGAEAAARLADARRRLAAVFPEG